MQLSFRILPKSMSLTSSKYHLLLFALALPLVVIFLQYASSDSGAQLLPAHIFSDAALFHYSAWFKATFSVNSYVSDIISLSPYEAALSHTIRLLGHSNAAPIFLNAILSASASFFIALVTRDAFGNLAAFISVIIFSLCAPILFFSGLPHKTILIVMLIALANYCVLKFFQTKAWAYLIVFSSVLMLASIDRIHVLTIPLLLICMLALQSHQSAVKKLYLKGIITTVLVIVIFNIVSNKYYGSEPGYLSSVGLNIYMGHTKPDNFLLRVNGITNNMLGHRTGPQRVAEKALNRPLTQSQTTAYWVLETLNYIQENPREYFRGQRQKLHHLFAQISTSFVSESLSVWRFSSFGSYVSVFDFASVFALYCSAILLLSLNKSWTPMATYLSLAGFIYLLSLMSTIVQERYRVGTFVFMLPLASFFLARVIQNWQKHKIEISMAVCLFGISHLLMLTAPAAYANKESIQKAREIAALKMARAASPFYQSRSAMDKEVNQANCSSLIIQLEMVGHRQDINTARRRCTDIIMREQEATRASQ